MDPEISEQNEDRNMTFHNRLKGKTAAAGLLMALIFCLSGGMPVLAEPAADAADEPAETQDLPTSAEAPQITVNIENDQVLYEEDGVRITFLTAGMTEDLIYPGEQLSVSYRIENLSDHEVFGYAEYAAINGLSVPVYFVQELIPAGESAETAVQVRAQLLQSAGITSVEQVGARFVIAGHDDPEQVQATPLLTAGSLEDPDAAYTVSSDEVLYDLHHITVSLLGFDTAEVEPVDPSVPDLQMTDLRFYCLVDNQSSKEFSLSVPKRNIRINGEPAQGVSVIGADNARFTAGDKGIAVFLLRVDQMSSIENADVYLQMTPQDKHGKVISFHLGEE